MTPERWRQVQDVLADAIAIAPAGRPALLDARCGSDLALKQEVESLLAAHDSEGVVDELIPLLSPATQWVRTPFGEWSGRRVRQYVIEDRVGAGGMAVVYRARDERLGRAVALKFLSPQSSADPSAKARFMTEARAAAALEHPNVCTIFEIGETDDGQLFIAMPLYEGETVHARLKRGRLPFPAALPIVLQVARGLEHAHECGIVHGDVKPSNIVLLPDGTAKILDFGIAHIQGVASDRPAAAIGTVAYMSPEQVAGGALDCRSDIWSLAVVLHEMIAGARPFTGESPGEVLEAVCRDDPALTAMSYPDVPDGVERVLRRALAKNPDQRYPSVSAMAAELSALAAETSGASEPAEHAARMTVTERRRAAVLVTLVSDYASLVDEVSPEEANRLIGRVRDAAVDVVREHGGLVNQAIGDEIVSLFGVPAAHEDDDLRAVRAALELHARVRAFAGGDPAVAVTLQVQSGLHVGPVVARRLHEGPRRYDVVGAPAAVASRLATLADRDALWVSPETQRLIAPYMHTAVCPAVVLESHAGPVAPFRVLGETGIATRLEAAAASLTPYVGRHGELATLRSIVARAADGHGAIVAVTGEAGAGKTRLLYELQQATAGAADVRMLSARCRAYGDGVPYGVFVQILCAALDLRPPLVADEVAARIRAVDTSLEPFLAVLLHVLLGRSEAVDLPRHLRGAHLEATLLEAMAAFISALTRRRPLVVLIEDCHWADTGSRRAFVHVAELATSAPLVLIATSRPDGNVTSGWPPQTVSLHLARLDYEASVAIIQSVLGVEQVPEPLARRLFDRAGGNPFYLEQICAALLEQQAVTVRDGGALIHGGEAALVIPDTVQGVIRARLDKLDAQALEIVRVASVIGWEFDHALLAEIAPAAVDLAPAIAALEAAGLIQQTAVAPTITYRFTHALTQEVCYDSLVGHQRKALHGAIGRALASAYADRLDDRAATLAHHFGRAEDWPAAIRFGRRAAERAIAVSQFGDALVMLDQLLEWAARLPGQQRDLIVELLLQQERVCETLGLRARQQQIIDSLIARLAGEGSSSRLAEVYLRQGDLSTLLKRFDAADRALATALRIGQERGDTTLLRSGLRSLGLLRWHEGRHAEAIEITERTLALDRQCDDDAAVAGDLSNLASILKSMGDYPRARARLEEALAMPALRYDPRKLLYVRHNLANVYREMGDLDRALQYLVENDETARVRLLPIQRSFHLTSIAHIQLQQGRVDAAVETYRTAVDLSRRARHAEGLVQSLRMLGNTLLGVTRYDEALPCLEEAADLFAQLEDRLSEAEMRSSVARVLEHTAPERAVDAWTAVLALQRARRDPRGELDACEGLARSLRLRGPDAAIPAFESALALAATIGERDREAAIRNVLGNLEWERGDYAEALKHYEAALAMVRGQGRPADEAILLNSLGVCLTRLARFEEARTVLDEALALSRSGDERGIEAHTRAALGQLALATRDLEEAARCFEQSRIARQAAGDRAGEGWMCLRLAELRRRAGDDAGAGKYARAAQAAASESGNAALAAACAEIALTSASDTSGEGTNAPLHH